MSDYVTWHGRIIERSRVPNTRHYKPKNKQEDKFRKTNAWTQKSLEIRERDHYLCRVCMQGTYGTISQLNYDSVEVHHIIKLCEDYEKRLDNDNLITLCKMHHRMADNGEIPKQYLLDLVESTRPMPIEN